MRALSRAPWGTDSPQTTWVIIHARAEGGAMRSQLGESQPLVVPDAVAVTLALALANQITKVEHAAKAAAESPIEILG